MKRRTPRLAPPVLTSLMLLMASLQPTQAQTWTGGGFINSAWSDARNWQGQQRPVSGAGTAITFAGNNRLNPTQDLASPFTLNSLSFAIGAGAFELGGNPLRFDGANARLTQSSVNSVVIANSLQVATNLLVDGPGSVTLAGNLARAAGASRDTLTLTKRGIGTLVLAKPNDFDASLRIEAGQVQLRHEQALPHASVFLLVNNGLSFVSMAQAQIGNLAGPGGLQLGTTALSLGSNEMPAGLHTGAITGSTGSITKVGAGTTRLAGSSQYRRLQVDAGRLQLEGGSQLLGDASEALMVGTGAAPASLAPELALSGGATVSALGTTTQVDGIDGTLLSVQGINSRLSTGFQTLVGNHARGVLRVDGGGTLNAGIYLAMGFNNASSGLLQVGPGGTVTGTIGLLGVQAGAKGQADVAGAGANWIVSQLGVGGFNKDLRGGTGLLNVSAGGQVQVADAMTFWSLGGAATVNGGTLRAGLLVSEAGVGRISLQADPVGGSALVLGGSSSNASFGGDIEGEGGLRKLGGGTQSLDGRNLFTGAVQVLGGTLQMSNGSAYEYEVRSGATLRLGERNLGLAVLQAEQGGRIVYTPSTLNGGLLIGSGVHDIQAVQRLVSTRIGPGAVLTPSAGTTFVGLVNDGRVELGAGRHLTWTGGSNASGLLAVGGTLNVSSFHSGGEIQVAPGGALVTSSGNLVLGAGSRTAVGSAEAAGGRIEVLGQGRVQLNGGLLVNNGQVQGTLEVNYGGLAKGAGEYGTVIVGDGGRFSPGNSPGHVTTGDTTWGAGGQLLVELADATGVAGMGWDLWTVQGGLSLQSGVTANSRFTVSVSTLGALHQPGALAGFDSSRAWQWLIVDTQSGFQGFDVNRLTLDTQGFLSPLSGGQLSLAVTDGDLYLQFAPVPEPQAWALMLGGLGLLRCASRRFKAASRN
ncbi:MAG: autotransporter-associated beta strand repeat-containing protein [Burkholderiales bacterium]|nr:autotransporter-associated beta strand repeat-containing protein [Burkholderiales bacterium]